MPIGSCSSQSRWSATSWRWESRTSEAWRARGEPARARRRSASAALRFVAQLASTRVRVGGGAAQQAIAIPPDSTNVAAATVRANRALGCRLGRRARKLSCRRFVGADPRRHYLAAALLRKWHGRIPDQWPKSRRSSNRSPQSPPALLSRHRACHLTQARGLLLSPVVLHAKTEPNSPKSRYLRPSPAGETGIGSRRSRTSQRLVRPEGGGTRFCE
jgi:hypothetical protein